MNKRKSIIVLSILTVIIAVFSILTFVPTSSGEFGVLDYPSILGYINSDRDFDGGIYAIYKAEALEGEDSLTDTAMNGAVDKLTALLQSKYNSASVYRQGDEYIRVEIPSDSFSTSAIVYAETAEVEIVPDGVTADSEDYSTYAILGSHIKKAYTVEVAKNNFGIVIELNDEGTAIFSDATSQYAGSTFNINIDGEVLIAPKISTQITDGKIYLYSESGYSQENALTVVLKVTSGSYGVNLDMYINNTYTSLFGDNSILYVSLAIIAVFIAIFVALAVRSKLIGLAGIVSIVCFVLLGIFAMSVLFPNPLSLSTIIGIIAGFIIMLTTVLYTIIKIGYEYKKNSLRSTNTIINSAFKNVMLVVFDAYIILALMCIVLLLTGYMTTIAMVILVSLFLSFATAFGILRGLIALFVPIASNKALGINGNGEVTA